MQQVIYYYYYYYYYYHHHHQHQETSGYHLWVSEAAIQVDGNRRDVPAVS